MPMYRLTRADQEAFHRDGYFVVEDLFDTEEVALLRDITERILPMDPHLHEQLDVEGNVTRISVRYNLSDDVFSAAVRCPRIVETMATLLDDEVYHYHHKVMVKDPEFGGAWEWHQDYGYWYENYLAPTMGSCMISITRHTRENGCLKVVPGSHSLGRINHGTSGTQVGADPERVARILEQIPLVHCELPPGAGVFFHSNLLHRSDRNASQEPRLSLINCYNTVGNDSFQEVPIYDPPDIPGYIPLELGRDEDVKRIGHAQLDSLQAHT